MRIPVSLQEEWRGEPEWLAGLPRLARECADQWGLVLEQPIDSPRALVVPAGEAVLKLNTPSHFEADHEAAALACWAGSGAVRLLARDDGRRALLIERCRPGTRLRESEADPFAVIADLLPRLWLEPGAGHPFRSMADEAMRWTEEVTRRYEMAGRPFERRLLSVALDTFDSADRTARSLVNQDLHGANILRAEREPWLLIDPKPAVGEREMSAVGLLANAAWDGGVGAVRRWLGALGELGLDRDRLRDWGVAHALAWGSDRDGRWSPSSVEAARTILSA